MARVLIVDDQRETGHLLSRILHFLGHEGVHVPGGQEALSYLHESLPDAVLLDYMMPGMDGLEVLKAVKTDPRTHRLPVIMFSANNDPKVVALAMESGASDFWVKASLAINDMQSRLDRVLPLHG